jgi:hypothetical protein
MRGVDVVVHNPTAPRRHAAISRSRFEGGSANANMYCFNVTDGSGQVVQVNICDADAEGGDATLRNIRFHTAA